MKNKNQMAVMGLLLTFFVLLASGCGPAATNGNIARNENAAPSAANSNVATDSALTDSACSETNINDKLDKVRAAVAKKITNRPDLQAQITSGLFKYSIEIGPGIPGTTLDMYLEGGVGGKDNFYDLVKIITEFFKGSCTNRVLFVKPGTVRTSKPALPLTGEEFQWFACEEGYVPCPGGTCKQQCLVTPSPGVNTNSSANSNGNSKTRSNSNSNTGNK